MFGLAKRGKAKAKATKSSDTTISPESEQQQQQQQQPQQQQTLAAASTIRAATSSSGSTDRSDLTATNADEEEEDELTVEHILKWKFSESTLAAAIKLQTEKQKTKQEKLKLANLEKTLQILDSAINYNIPKESIVSLFSDLTQVSTAEATQKLHNYSRQQIDLQETTKKEETIPTNPATSSTITKTKSKPYTHTKGSQSLGSTAGRATTSVFKVNLPQTVQYQFHHWSGPSSSAKGPRKAEFDEESTRKQRKTSISGTNPIGNTSTSNINDTSFSTSANNSIMANSSLLYSNSQNTTILDPTGEELAGNDSLMIPPAPILRQPSLAMRGSPMRRNYHRRGLSESIIQRQPSHQQQQQQHISIPPAHQFVHVNAAPVSPAAAGVPNTPTRHRPSSQHSHSRQGSIDGYSMQKNFVFPTNNNIANSNNNINYSPPQYSSTQFSPSRFSTLSPPTISNVSAYSPNRQQQGRYLIAPGSSGGNPPESRGSFDATNPDAAGKGHQKTRSKIDLNFMLSPQGPNDNGNNADPSQ